MSASEACVINPDNPTGNMYFRGEWAYCPEYRTGDVVLHEGILYLSLKHNAGKPPDESVNREYWQKIIADKQNQVYMAERARLIKEYGLTFME